MKLDAKLREAISLFIDALLAGDESQIRTESLSKLIKLGKDGQALAKVFTETNNHGRIAMANILLAIKWKNVPYTLPSRVTQDDFITSLNTPVDKAFLRKPVPEPNKTVKTSEAKIRAFVPTAIKNFVTELADEVGLIDHAPAYKEIFRSFTKSELFAFMLFHDRANMFRRESLEDTLIAFHRAGRRVHIPDVSNFVDNHKGIFKINFNKFWKCFNELNAVSPARASSPPTPPGKDSGYESLATRLEEETKAFRQKVAATILPALKNEMQLRAHEKYDEKIELVRWVNAELRRFELAIKHPKTGLPASFKAKPGNDPEIGSFQLLSEDSDGKEKSFTTPDLATLLDKLELMNALPRREALAEWHEKVGRQRRGPSGTETFLP